MSIQRLPIFLSAAEHLNFTKAAEEHHISQTAVSQQIKQLEKELGFQLFNRGKRGVSLTPAGMEYYRQCKKIMVQYETAVSKGQRVAGGIGESLTIGYAGAYELWNATKLIRHYYHAYPDSQIDLRFASNQVLLGEVSSGKIDIAVICEFGVELSDWLAARELSNDPCVLMISSAHPLAQKPVLDRKDLVNLPIALNRAQDTQTTASQILQMYSHLGMSGNKRYYIDDFYSLAMLVSSGLAVSVVPDSMQQMGPDGLAFIPIKGFHSTARTMVVYRKENQSSAIKHLLSLL
ncbi:MAG: LysR family transcriptional regulator [Oscillospiraceae bacterium]|nr:LysR family transcriptional regulator [Oscillospiraceae bacterium]